jgi:hypothetical protein
VSKASESAELSAEPLLFQADEQFNFQFGLHQVLSENEFSVYCTWTARPAAYPSNSDSFLGTNLFLKQKQIEPVQYSSFKT